MNTHSLHVAQELLESRAFLLVHRVSTSLEDLGAQLVVYLIQHAFERGESASESSWLQHEIDLGDFETTCFRLSIR